MAHPRREPTAPHRQEILQTFIDFCLDWLQRQEFTLTVDVDMARWVEVMRHAPSISAITPTYDPRFSPLSPHNSFWLDIRLGSETIATSAARKLVCEDFLSLMRTGHLWFDPPRSNRAELALTPPLDMPKIAGRIGYEGGLWIHPDHRKKGLSVILPHLNRALCHREWDVDWQVGITLRSLGESGLAHRAYGFPHAARCFEGRSPITDTYDHLYVVYMDAEELLAGLELHAVTRLLPNAHKQPVDSVTRINER